MLEQNLKLFAIRQCKKLRFKSLDYDTFYIDVTRFIGVAVFLGSKSNLGQGAKVAEWLLPQKKKENDVLVYMAPVQALFCDLPTQYGTFRLIAYQDQISNDIHLALVYGALKKNEPVLVRVHVQNTLCDLFSGTFNDSWPLRDAMDYVARAGSGVIVILRNYDTNRSIVQQIEAHRLGQQASGTTNKDQPGDLRTIGIGAQILTDLGIRQMRVMSAPKHLHALAGFDLEVTEFVATRTT